MTLEGLKSRKPARVAVVGAGVMGCSIAMRLAERGDVEVVVVDKGEVGGGMSGRSSALVRMHYSFPPEVRLALRSLHTYSNWTEITGHPSFLRITGFVRLVPALETDRLRANVAMQRALGVDVRLLAASDLLELEPDWCVDDVTEAAYEPGSGYGDGSLAASDMMSRARALGAVCTTGCRVIGPRIEHERVVGITTEAGVIEADAVVLATGPWTGDLLGTGAPRLPLDTELHEVVIMRPPAPPRGHGCALIDSANGMYLRREATHMFLVGSYFGLGNADPDDFRQVARSDTIASLLERATRRVPELMDAGIAATVTGVYDMTPDSRPLVGPVLGVDGLFVVAGFSGMGFKLAPAIGEDVATMVVAGTPAGLDIEPFAIDRFARALPIHGEHEYAFE